MCGILFNVPLWLFKIKYYYSEFLLISAKLLFTNNYYQCCIFVRILIVGITLRFLVLNICLGNKKQLNIIYQIILLIIIEYVQSTNKYVHKK